MLIVWKSAGHMLNADTGVHTEIADMGDVKTFLTWLLKFYRCGRDHIFTLCGFDKKST